MCRGNVRAGWHGEFEHSQAARAGAIDEVIDGKATYFYFVSHRMCWLLDAIPFMAVF